MTLDLYLCLLAVVLRRYKIRGWISKLASGDAEINVEHGPYCRCDGCRDEPNEMMRWCLIDYATLPERRPREEPREFPKATHCHQGHPFTEENTLATHGGRACRTCTLERSRKYYRKHRSKTA